MTPPLQVLQTALTHPKRLQFIHDGLETEDYEYSVFLYFLELNSTIKAGQRVFDIYLNNEIKKERFDVLAGGSKYSYTILNISANGSLNITLVKASESKFGPLLNAYEILQIRPWIEETNHTDGKSSSKYNHGALSISLSNTFYFFSESYSEAENRIVAKPRE